jgi:hypothetical protein
MALRTCSKATRLPAQDAQQHFPSTNALHFPLAQARRRPGWRQRPPPSTYPNKSPFSRPLPGTFQGNRKSANMLHTIYLAPTYTRPPAHLAPPLPALPIPSPCARMAPGTAWPTSVYPDMHAWPLAPQRTNGCLATDWLHRAAPTTKALPASHNRLTTRTLHRPRAAAAKKPSREATSQQRPANARHPPA